MEWGIGREGQRWLKWNGCSNLGELKLLSFLLIYCNDSSKLQFQTSKALLFLNLWLALSRSAALEIAACFPIHFDENAVVQPTSHWARCRELSGKQNSLLLSSWNLQASGILWISYKLMIISQDPMGAMISMYHKSTLQNMTLNLTGGGKYRKWCVWFQKWKKRDSRDFEALILFHYYFCSLHFLLFSASLRYNL